MNKLLKTWDWPNNKKLIKWCQTKDKSYNKAIKILFVIFKAKSQIKVNSLKKKLVRHPNYSKKSNSNMQYNWKKWEQSLRPNSGSSNI